MNGFYHYNTIILLKGPFRLLWCQCTSFLEAITLFFWFFTEIIGCNTKSDVTTMESIETSSKSVRHSGNFIEQSIIHRCCRFLLYFLMHWDDLFPKMAFLAVYPQLFFRSFESEHVPFIWSGHSSGHKWPLRQT